MAEKLTDMSRSKLIETAVALELGTKEELSKKANTRPILIKMIEESQVVQEAELIGNPEEDADLSPEEAEELLDEDEEENPFDDVEEVDPEDLEPAEEEDMLSDEEKNEFTGSDDESDQEGTEEEVETIETPSEPPLNAAGKFLVKKNLRRNGVKYAIGKVVNEQETAEVKELIKLGVLERV